MLRTQDEWDELDEAAMQLDSALNLIGEPGKTDHDVAKIIVEHEIKMRRMVSYILQESTAAAQRS